MVQPGESDSKGKAVVGSSEPEPEPEPKPEFKCPRCSKVFHSAPALCGHQNAHRLVKEPMKMSPVLAAVLNNPLPPHDKPVLIPPRPKPGVNPSAVKELVSKPRGGAENVSPRYHPYKRLDKEPIQLQDNLRKEITSSYYNNPHKKPEGEAFLSQLLQKEPQYHPYEMVVPEYNQEYSLPQCLTMDLLGEWMPISGFEDHGHLGTSCGETLSHPILRNYLMEGKAGLQIGSKTSSTGHLDLELKLGF